jgi:hypothetical protein
MMRLRNRQQPAHTPSSDVRGGLLLNVARPEATLQARMRFRSVAG